MSTAAHDDRRIFGVGELMRGIRRLLEDRVGRQWVVGEISNLHEAASGHAYLTLKDDGGQAKAVCFRSVASDLPFRLEEGMEVLVYAEISVYEPRGDLQLVLRHVEPRGAGALQLAFEQLRARLEAEGLFDEGRKTPPPEHPRRVGVVTSLQGAALRDVLRVSAERFPATPLLVSPTRVQGEGAEHEIAAALERVAAQPEIDVVLLVRGGGSLEDLWSFNTETVVRAIVACEIPIVCGVGHETDVTLADLAADRRAATPSAAVLEALPDGAALEAVRSRLDRSLRWAMRSRLDAARTILRGEVDALRALAPAARLRAQRDRLVQWSGRLGTAMDRAARGRRDRLTDARRSLRPRSIGVAERRARLDPLARALAVGLRRAAEARRGRLGGLAGRLDSLSPLAVLARGYALVQRVGDDRIVRSAADVASGDRVRIRAAEVSVEAAVETVHPLPPAGASEPSTD